MFFWGGVEVQAVEVWDGWGVAASCKFESVHSFCFGIFPFTYPPSPRSSLPHAGGTESIHDYYTVKEYGTADKSSISDSCILLCLTRSKKIQLSQAKDKYATLAGFFGGRKRRRKNINTNPGR